MRISDWSSDVCSSDLDRSVTRPRPHTGEARGEAGVVLPALRGHALDGGLRILPGNTARRQLVRQFLARVFAPDQQPQRALRGAGLGPATLAPAFIGRRAGAVLRHALAIPGRHAPVRPPRPRTPASPPPPAAASRARPPPSWPPPPGCARGTCGASPFPCPLVPP